MKIPKELFQDQELLLRNVRPNDCKGNYRRWMNDPETTRFLESRFRPWNTDDLIAYLTEMNSNPDILFLAIVKTDSGQHIGNIKLWSINPKHKFTEIGLIIDKRYWGKGYGASALRLLSDYAFSTLRLHKVWAGCYEPNIGAIKAFKKAGFVEEGRFKSQYLLDGKYVDDIILGKVNDQRTKV